MFFATFLINIYFMFFVSFLSFVVLIYVCLRHREWSKTRQHSKWNCVGANRPQHMNMWRRTCSSGDPTPERQCSGLLSTYLKESEEQKEVLEAKDDEEQESELDGKVEQ